MPISLHVQIMRQAISPRLAIRILRKRRMSIVQSSTFQFRNYWRTLDLRLWGCGLTLLDSKKRLTVFNGLSVLDVNLHHLAGRLGLNLVHQLHRLDDADDAGWFDVTADAHEAVRRR